MGNNPMGGLGSMLGNLFGGSAPHRQEDYQNLSQQYNQYQQGNVDHSQFDPQQVQQQYRNMLRNAPPDVADAAHAQAFQQLPPQQREQLAQQMQQYQQQGGATQQQYDPSQVAQDPRALGQMMRQTEQQSPGVLDQLFGGAQGPMNNPLVKMALAGAAAAAASHFLGGGGGGLGSAFQNTADIGGGGSGGDSPFGGTQV